MTDEYVGITVRSEVLEKDGITVDLETLKKIAVEAMGYYYQYLHKNCPEIKIEKLFSDNLGIEEYDVSPKSNLRIRLSLEPENYAPLNCWMEVDCPNSKEWALLMALGCHLSTQFPKLTFNISSSFFCKATCAESEKYTNLFKNGTLIRQLTRQEWVEGYLNTKYVCR